MSMKYFIFLVCIASLIVGIFGVIMYFTDIRVGYSWGQEISYDEDYLIISAIGFGVFVFTVFYLRKNNFFKQNN